MIAKTQRELAASLGKSQPAVNKWIKDSRWTLSKSGPWDVEEVKAWAARTLGLVPAKSAAQPSLNLGFDADPKLDGRLGADLYLKTQRAKLLAFELRQLEKEYVLRSEMEQGRIDRIQAVKSSLERMPGRLAPQLAGMTDEVAIETVIEAEVIKILHAFSRETEK